MTIAYAIMPIGKKRCEYPCGHTKSPGVPAPGLFYSVLARWFIPSGWLPLLVSIQPFANIVGNYTCRNGDKKRCKNIHANTPPFSTIFYTESKKTDKNRTVRINQELTSMHQEVIENLESIHGALLRMNRSIQAEGTFGIMKNDRWYKRIVRRGIHSVKLEVLLVAIGHNLYKYQKKKMRNRTAA